VIKTPLDITENSDVDTVSLREWIAKHSDHLDEGIHELQQQIAALNATVAVMAAKVETIHADVEAARPMVEKWQRSAIGRIAGGTMPWAKP
jgi:phage shock protein A